MSDNQNQKYSDQDYVVLRHSYAHALAKAVKSFWPEAKNAIGPAIDDGFYQDFDMGEVKVSEDDFPKIEKKMREIIAKWDHFDYREVTLTEAKKLFADNPYKVALATEFAGDGKKLTVNDPGDFLDLCKMTHVENPSKTMQYFKLLSVAGAYWRGDEKNKMLTRIYGTAFFNQSDLDQHLVNLEEAKKHDHRKLGKELDLYSTSPLTGPGLILWHPKLASSRNAVENFWREEHIKRDYQLVYTPHIASMDMFVKTRHYTKYINSMFPAMLHQNIEGESKDDYSGDEQLKPMNCPNHVQIFKARPRSYRELPFRMGELGTVYRYEKAGVLHGMTRVRGFTQDDSHIFCTPDQVINEVREVIKLTRYVYEDIFDFKDYQAYLSTRPEKYLGTLEMWDFAQDSLKKAMELENIEYKVDEGAGVFYGPKIDSKVKDSLGREWQLGTIQFDFNLPTYSESSEKDVDDFWVMKTFKDKFKTRKNLAKYVKQMGRGLDVKYIDKDGKEKTAMMIHRVVLGSLERFFGILLEHFGGAFPVWLSPIQARIIPITDKQLDYAQKVEKTLKEQGVRVEIDDKAQTLQNKIRTASMEKIPYQLILGGREAEAGTLSVRQRDGQDVGVVTVEQFLSQIKEQISTKSLSLIK